MIIYTFTLFNLSAFITTLKEDTIARFEAQYDDADMVSPPAITVEGDATLFALSDRRIVGRRHFTTKVQAINNRVVDIVTAFDRATTCFTADVADWVTASAAHLAPVELPVCTTAS